ncbi:MAG: serine/threonine-protein phosphatase [Deltaproteobacteria bacterium]|nr:serine/threonine-protein phosphatase [Deltaproteobacteria bacterium]
MLAASVHQANRDVVEMSQANVQHKGMGSTVVVLKVVPAEGCVHICHVGDSRCYRVRDGVIGQLTNDHSLVSEVSEIAPWLTDAEVQELPTNVITRALGMAPDVVVDLLSTPTQVGDVYLLCSDGLNGMVGDDEILDVLSRDESLEDICAGLIDKANGAGGVDNTTVVVAKIDEGDPDEDAPSSCVIDADDTVEVAALPPDAVPDGFPDSDRS